MIRTVELEGMLDVALATAAAPSGAPSRAALTPAPTTPTATTPTGSSTRSPLYRPDGPPALVDKPVALGMFEPQERKY